MEGNEGVGEREREGKGRNGEERELILYKNRYPSQKSGL